MRALDIDFESFACRLMRIGRSESESEFNERALRLISEFGFGFWLCKLLVGSKRIRYFDRVNGREVRGARWEAGGGPRLDLYYFLKVKKAFNWTVLWICRFFVRRRCVVSFSAFVFHFHFFLSSVSFLCFTFERLRSIKKKKHTYFISRTEARANFKISKTISASFR